MAVNAKGFGHCVLVFKLDNMWHVLDYTTIHDGYLNLETSIFAYNEQVPSHYGIKNKVFYNAGWILGNHIAGSQKSVPHSAR
jgi:hypothetical protein